MKYHFHKFSGILLLKVLKMKAFGFAAYKINWSISAS